MAAILKVDTIQDTSGNNIINENANTITIGKAGDTTNIVGTLQNDGAALVTGKILQVVQGTQTTPVLTTSSSYVTTGLTASITPSSSSNKILIMTTLTVSNRASGGEMMCTLFRDSTNIITSGSQDGFNQNFNSAGRQDATASCVFLDSPSTTNSTAYAVFIKAQGGTAESMSEGTTGSIVLMEVDA
jgi:hypothetical protein